MRARDLSRPGRPAAADQRRRGDGVVRRPIWALPVARRIVRPAADAGDPGHLERLVIGQRRQQGGRACAPPGSCRRRAGPASAGCDRPRRRSRVHDGAPADRGDRPGPAARRATLTRSGAAAPAAHRRRGPEAGRDGRGRAPRGHATKAASRASSGATTIPRMPQRRARSAIASTPATGRIEPSSASSPASGWRLSAWRGICAEAPSSAAAIARSNPGPALGRSAGARLAVMRCSGKVNPELVNAARTRSRDSLTAASGSPTIANPGSPLLTSISTWTGSAWTPIRVSVRETASTRPP